MRQSRALFELGQIVATKAVNDSISNEKLMTIVRQHVTGDFGVLDIQDIDLNMDAINTNDRVLSAYMVDGQKVYIITEWDRSYTSVLFADEY